MELKPIERTALWNKFKGKFGWSGNAPRAVMLQPHVVPVTLIDDCLSETSAKDSGNVIVSGVGYKTVFTVPTHKRWHMQMFQLNKIDGDFTFANLRVKKADGDYVSIFNVATQTEYYSGVLGSVLTLDESDVLESYVDGYVSLGNMRCRAWIKEEYMS